MVRAKGRSAREHAERYTWGYTSRGESGVLHHGGGMTQKSSRRRKREY